ncbi:hypothetical protein CYMTET_24676 [Cymbomonas tetramitiformis]|uniref:Cyclic nucleotide-binding domain-containing protein n=1 Tax=Cymbomonas tetramitiformis TaxID=36881 RepID=A0AAE0KZU5_9CHLO|nr:hypothetical protein CYMTET_24676 [Cymbomonas tetramitiformis]
MSDDLGTLSPVVLDDKQSVFGQHGRDTWLTAQTREISAENSVSNKKLKEFHDTFKDFASSLGDLRRKQIFARLNVLCGRNERRGREFVELCVLLHHLCSICREQHTRELQEMARHVLYGEYGQSKKVVSAGDSPEFMFIVLDGEVQLEVRREKGSGSASHSLNEGRQNRPRLKGTCSRRAAAQSEQQYTVRTGQTFGETELLRGAEYRWTAKAMNSCKLLKVPREAMLTLFGGAEGLFFTRISKFLTLEVKAFTAFMRDNCARPPTEEAVLHFASLLSVMCYPKGMSFTNLDEGDRICFILEGGCQLCAQSTSSLINGEEEVQKDEFAACVQSQQVKLGVMTRGHFFGESGLIEASRHGLAVQMVTPVLVLEASLENISKHVDPDVLTALELQSTIQIAYFTQAYHDRKRSKFDRSRLRRQWRKTLEIMRDKEQTAAERMDEENKTLEFVRDDEDDDEADLVDSSVLLTGRPDSCVPSVLDDHSEAVQEKFKNESALKKSSSTPKLSTMVSDEDDRQVSKAQATRIVASPPAVCRHHTKALHTYPYNTNHYVGRPQRISTPFSDPGPRRARHAQDKGNRGPSDSQGVSPLYASISSLNFVENPRSMLGRDPSLSHDIWKKRVSAAVPEFSLESYGDQDSTQEQAKHATERRISLPFLTL